MLTIFLPGTLPAKICQPGKFTLLERHPHLYRDVTNKSTHDTKHTHTYTTKTTIIMACWTCVDQGTLCVFVPCFALSFTSLSLSLSLSRLASFRRDIYKSSPGKIIGLHGFILNTPSSLVVLCLQTTTSYIEAFCADL